MNTITINGKKVEAKKVIGQLAIHYTLIERDQFVPYGGFTGWTLTHIKSGMAIAVGHYYQSPSLKQFEELARRLAVIDLDAYWDGGQVDKTAEAQTKLIRHDWLEEVGNQRVKTVLRTDRNIMVSAPELANEGVTA